MRDTRGLQVGSTAPAAAMAGPLANVHMVPIVEGSGDVLTIQTHLMSGGIRKVGASLSRRTGVAQAGSSTAATAAI